MEGGEGCANRLDSVGLKSVREMMKPWKQLTAASLGLALALLAGCATAERETPSAAASPVVDPAAVAADAVTSTSGENIGAMVDPAIAQAGAQQATAAPATASNRSNSRLPVPSTNFRARTVASKVIIATASGH